MKKEYSAGGIVYRKIEGIIEILFILDPYNKWAFPKGHVESGETMSQAALREIKEETGIFLDGLRIVEDLGSIKYKFQLHGQKIYKSVQFYLVRARVDAKASPQKREGIKAIRWIEAEKAMSFLAYDDSQPVLRKAIQYLLTR